MQRRSWPRTTTPSSIAASGIRSATTPVRPFAGSRSSAPQPGATVEDTVFAEGHALPDGLDVPYWRDHFDAAELPQPSGAILEGFDAANVGGAALKILVGPATGASQLNLMVVQYVPGGFINPHDHAFEEGFFFLEGEIEANLGGEISTLRAGDYCWSSVGDMHALKNRSDGVVRWLETQVPQPPAALPGAVHRGVGTLSREVVLGVALE